MKYRTVEIIIMHDFETGDYHGRLQAKTMLEGGIVSGWKKANSLDELKSELKKVIDSLDKVFEIDLPEPSSYLQCNELTLIE